MAPKLGALAFIRIDWPAIAMVCETPSSLLASRSTFFITCWVRASDDESGSCTLTSRYPLSCAGMKPGRRAREGPVGQPEQTAVDQ